MSTRYGKHHPTPASQKARPEPAIPEPAARRPNSPPSARPAATRRGQAPANRYAQPDLGRSEMADLYTPAHETRADLLLAVASLEHGRRVPYAALIQGRIPGEALRRAIAALRCVGWTRCLDRLGHPGMAGEDSTSTKRNQIPPTSRLVEPNVAGPAGEAVTTALVGQLPRWGNGHPWVAGGGIDLGF